MVKTASVRFLPDGFGGMDIYNWGVKAYDPTVEVTASYPQPLTSRSRQRVKMRERKRAAKNLTLHEAMRIARGRLKKLGKLDIE